MNTYESPDGGKTIYKVIKGRRFQITAAQLKQELKAVGLETSETD